jgi:hypothetical protein
VVTGGDSISPETFSTVSPEASRRTSIGKAAAGLVVLAVIILGLILMVRNSGPSNDVSTSNSSGGPPDASTSKTAPTAAEPAAPPKPQMPPASGITLHPYDLLKNPYQAKEKLVLLDLNSRPVLYDGAVIQYSGPVNPTIGARFGLMALRLDRMADENVALYNIMGIEAGASDGGTLGQLAVALPEGTTELRLDRNWMVEPLGPLKGTNYVGADIQIPAVRFWRYVGEGGSPPPASEPVPPGKGFRYEKYPDGYLVDELCTTKEQGFCYSFHWQPWIKDLESKIAGDQANKLLADTGTASPGNLVISWDSEERVVFNDWRSHDGSSASAFFIVAPKTRAIDIVWQRGDHVTYLGPDATLLSNAHAYEWLKQIGP